MIPTVKQTKPWDVKSSYTRIKRLGHEFNITTLAADIRHHCTNYVHYELEGNIL